MNNFLKFCAFYLLITFAHGRPPAGGGAYKIQKKYASIGGGHFRPLKGLFSLSGGFFPLLEAFYFIFGGHFLHVGDLIFFYMEKYLGLSPLTKYYAGAHALAARVVAKLIHVCRLWEIERNCEIYLLKHFGAHFKLTLHALSENDNS